MFGEKEAHDSFNVSLILGTLRSVWCSRCYRNDEVRKIPADASGIYTIDETTKGCNGDVEAHDGYLTMESDLNRGGEHT